MSEFSKKEVSKLPSMTYLAHGMRCELLDDSGRCFSHKPVIITMSALWFFVCVLNLMNNNLGLSYGQKYIDSKQIYQIVSNHGPETGHILYISK